MLISPISESRRHQGEKRASTAKRTCGHCRALDIAADQHGDDRVPTIPDTFQQRVLSQLASPM
jgi:hypothetical protein